MTAQKIWKGQAPSNIALIKYMGKTKAQGNSPTNASFSYTLNHLQTFVELEAGGSEDRWNSLPGELKVELSEKGQARFLKHLQLLKSQFNYQGFFQVRSGNGFPADCGLARSASSFAALTKVATQALSELTSSAALSIEKVADLSRQGSGSSCRSFFSPWAVWDADGVRPISLPYTNLVHQVFVIDEKVKTVSSSEAHQRVASSALFAGRIERAEQRLAELLAALQSKNWAQAFELTWAEFWDMHALFETSRPSFGYMNPGSMDVTQTVASEYWRKDGDGPLVTMDAGPNVHLLYKPEQLELAKQIEKRFSSKYKILSSYAPLWNRGS